MAGDRIPESGSRPGLSCREHEFALSFLLMSAIVYDF